MTYQTGDYHIDEPLTNKALTSINPPSEAHTIGIGNGTVVLDYTLTLQIGYNAPNQAPTGLSLSDTTVQYSEGGSNVAVGVLSTTDPDAEDSHSYSLVAGTGSDHNNLFAISDNTLLATTPLDMEPGTYSVRIRTKDADGLIYESIFSILVVDNLPPVVESISALEGSTGTVEYTVTFSEPVSGVTTDDFSLAATGTASGAISGVLGDTDSYTVTVSNLAGDGSLGLDLISANDVVDASGNPAGAYSAGETYYVDLTPPEINESNISLSGGSGTNGAFKVGDTITATWNDTDSGDNNSDTIGAVTMDFSQFGGGSAVAATNSSGSWSASYTLTAGNIDGTNKNVAVTATDDAGNATTTADTSNATVDNDVPTVTGTNISVSGATGTGGTFIVGDTITVEWANSAEGNSDIVSALADFTFLGGTPVPMTDVNGDGTLFTASATITAGPFDSVAFLPIITDDDAGNTTIYTDLAPTVDNQAPMVTDGNRRQPLHLRCQWYLQGRRHRHGHLEQHSRGRQ